jgi:hypothetical protein
MNSSLRMTSRSEQRFPWFFLSIVVNLAAADRNGGRDAVGTIEMEPGLQEDLPNILDKLIPPSRDYGHERAWHDGNGHSHLSPSKTASSYSAPGSKSSILSATSNRAGARLR